MPKDSKSRKTTSEDVPFQIGKRGGAAKGAARAIERTRARRNNRLDAIMDQMRRNQSTDSHQ